MIILYPHSDVLKKYPHIDFDALSVIFSAFVNKEDFHVLSIGLIKGKYSYYTWDSKNMDPTFEMSMSITSEEAFIEDLIHEFRHFMQEKVLKIESKKDFPKPGSKKYWDSDIEKDAFNFERTSGKKIISLYNSIKKFKKTTSNARKFNPS